VQIFTSNAFCGLRSWGPNIIETELSPFLGKIHQQDCVEGMSNVPAGSVDLVFADPPFNIGYEYDEYDDRLDEAKYLDWSGQWMSQVYRILKSDGTFWLAIGDEYAAELKVEAKKIGFHMRNWTIWYYTFGVHCSSKFTRSHAHLFYFVKDPKKFTFNLPGVSVPSARQLVYADKRANPAGRSPDDTWILRPQDCTDGFQANEDTWYIPRVAGTFKERAGFHGCQMPEQLLGRIIRASSNEGEVVVDPFSGSSTTLTVAKKLGRAFFGFELSTDYAERGTARLSNALVGDPLEGAEEPRASAPSTYEHLRTAKLKERSLFDLELDAEASGLIEAFKQVHRGFSVERVIADPLFNEDFQTHCSRLSLPGSEAERNQFLLRLSKSGQLKTAGVQFQERTEFDWPQIDEFLHASEIAWTQVSELYNASLEEIICDPRMAKEFDRVAEKFAPGRTSLEYRWAAIRLRREASIRLRNLCNASPDVESVLEQDGEAIERLKATKIPPVAGVYVIKSAADGSRCLYVGESQNLQRRLKGLIAKDEVESWYTSGKSDLQIQIFAAPLLTRLANQLTVLQKTQGSDWNHSELTKSALFSDLADATAS
jgi:DNA modification methylase